ncbi:hypothetical protein Hdeb2414_s0015g00436901 [Helianthus debilis subsp. tardiflorus]
MSRRRRRKKPEAAFQTVVSVGASNCETGIRRLALSVHAHISCCRGGSFDPFDWVNSRYVLSFYKKSIKIKKILP